MKKTLPDGNKTLYPSTTPQKAAASLRAGSGGLYEVDKTPGGAVKRTVTYYPAAGATLAPHCVRCSAGVRINTVGGSNSVYYLLKDHLGSASVITDSTGTVVGEQRYYPYGETRFTSGTLYTDKLFTGQRDVGLGIYHYGARFYSPKLGRFLSPDSIVPGAANPQAFNRYSYVLGNPLKYIDPTGHYCVGDDEDCADEGGYGPAPTGSNNTPAPQPEDDFDPHDDDDFDPNPGCAGCTVPATAPDLNNGYPPPDGEYCSSTFLTCAANFTQDMATTIDVLFAGLEVVLVVGGCAGAGPAGCGGGLFLSWQVFNMGPNQLEASLSGLSLVFTATEDYLDDGAFGESSLTSLVTFLVGGVSPDPIGDLAIDGYASGYNHGFFNGVDDMLFGAPLLQDPIIYK